MVVSDSLQLVSKGREVSSLLRIKKGIGVRWGFWLIVTQWELAVAVGTWYDS